MKEVSIDYFDPSKGLGMSLEDKMDEIFQGEKEIYLVELSKTYSSTPYGRVKLQNDIEAHFYDVCGQQNKTVQIPESKTPEHSQTEVVPAKPKNALLKYERFFYVLRIFRDLLTLLLLGLSICGAFYFHFFCTEPFAIWLKWFCIAAIPGVIVYWLLSTMSYNFFMTISKKVRILEEN